MTRHRSGGRVESSVAYFDRTAASWSAAYDAATAGGHALRERRRRLLELLSGLSGDLLDVGCGSAALARDLVDRGWRFVGADASPAMITHARSALRATGGLGVAVADARALPFRDGCFDAVICLGVLDRVNEQGEAIAEIVRVARPGARLIVSFPNRRSPYTRWSSSVFRPAVGRVKSLAAWVRGRARLPDLASSAILHSPRSATALFEDAGATVSTVVHFYYNLLLSPLDELFPRLAARVVTRLEALHATRLAWLGSGFLVAARRPA